MKEGKKGREEVRYGTRKSEGRGKMKVVQWEAEKMKVNEERRV